MFLAGISNKLNKIPGAALQGNALIKAIENSPEGELEVRSLADFTRELRVLCPEEAEKYVTFAVNHANAEKGLEIAEGTAWATRAHKLGQIESKPSDARFVYSLELEKVRQATAEESKKATIKVEVKQESSDEESSSDERAPPDVSGEVEFLIMTKAECTARIIKEEYRLAILRARHEYQTEVTKLGGGVNGHKSFEAWAFTQYRDVCGKAEMEVAQFFTDDASSTLRSHALHNQMHSFHGIDEPAQPLFYGIWLALVGMRPADDLRKLSATYKELSFVHRNAGAGQGELLITSARAAYVFKRKFDTAPAVAQELAILLCHCEPLAGLPGMSFVANFYKLLTKNVRDTDLSDFKQQLRSVLENLLVGPRLSPAAGAAAASLAQGMAAGPSKPPGAAGSRANFQDRFAGVLCRKCGTYGHYADHCSRALKQPVPSDVLPQQPAKPGKGKAGKQKQVQLNVPNGGSTTKVSQANAVTVDVLVSSSESPLKPLGDTAPPPDLHPHGPALRREWLIAMGCLNADVGSVRPYVSSAPPLQAALEAVKKITIDSGASTNLAPTQFLHSSRKLRGIVTFADGEIGTVEEEGKLLVLVKGKAGSPDFLMRVDAWGLDSCPVPLISPRFLAAAGATLVTKKIPGVADAVSTIDFSEVGGPMLVLGERSDLEVTLIKPPDFAARCDALRRRLEIKHAVKRASLLEVGPAPALAADGLAASSSVDQGK